MIYLARSITIFLLLYGLVAVVADRAYFQRDVSALIASQIALAILLFQYLVAPWIIRFLMDIDWAAELPASNLQALERLCVKEGLPMPSIGVIHSPVPNAFTFGRIQSDASIVVTSGLLEALTPEEVDAVIAHEVGHIKHWDFLVITAAAAAPLILYQIYALARRFRDDHWSAWLAYAAYWVAEFFVLSLSRTREYWADHFAARSTGNPDALASALVKVCYGMAVVAEREIWTRKHGDAQQQADARAQSRLSGKIGVLGISVRNTAMALSGSPTPDRALPVMRWDLVNPWARIYQFLSTHPLTALRVRALNRISAALGRPAEYPVPTESRIEWGRFPLELVLWTAPWAFALCCFELWLMARQGHPAHVAGVMCSALLMLSWILRVAYRYSGRFQTANIRELLEDTVPSNMRPRAVRIEGEIISRGEPGAWWSPDMIIRDGTAPVFVLDRQSIPLARLLRASEVEGLIGRQVVLYGWYRRGPVPYVELSRVEIENTPPYHSYSRWIQCGCAVAVGALSFWLT